MEFRRTFHGSGSFRLTRKHPLLECVYSVKVCVWFADSWCAFPCAFVAVSVSVCEQRTTRLSYRSREPGRRTRWQLGAPTYLLGFRGCEITEQLQNRSTISSCLPLIVDRSGEGAVDTEGDCLSFLIYFFFHFFFPAVLLFKATFRSSSARLLRNQRLFPRLLYGSYLSANERNAFF